jgi:pSer/pThr/pTyr-binding forkhead associated (FHA) protein
MGRNLVMVSHSQNTPPSRIILVPGTYDFGRSRKCRIRLTDPTVSRHHAEVIVTEHEAKVFDLGSHNGTYVDDVQVKASSIRLGQYLRFGDIAFHLKSDEECNRSIESEIETADPLRESPICAPQPTRKILTPAQRRVFDLLLIGLPEQEVADRLKLSPHTVHNHTRAIYVAFGVHSRIELIALRIPQT